MNKMNRRQAREEVFSLLFETEFQTEKTPEEILALASEVRDIPEDAYIRSTYLGVRANIEKIDAEITQFADGWKIYRMTPATRSALRLATYEMMFAEDVPPVVSINEAIELIKKFDDMKLKGFANGILNSIKNHLCAEEQPKEESAQA